jgi:hypothetical protein
MSDSPFDELRELIVRAERLSHKIGEIFFDEMSRKEQEELAEVRREISGAITALELLILTIGRDHPAVIRAVQMSIEKGAPRR